MDCCQRGWGRGNGTYKNVSKEQFSLQLQLEPSSQALIAANPTAGGWAGKPARWKLPFWGSLENRSGCKIAFKIGSEILSLPRIDKIWKCSCQFQEQAVTSSLLQLSTRVSPSVAHIWGLLVPIPDLLNQNIPSTAQESMFCTVSWSDSYIF